MDRSTRSRLALPVALVAAALILCLPALTFVGGSAPRGLRGASPPASAQMRAGAYERYEVAAEEQTSVLPSPARLGAAAASLLAALLVALAPAAEAQAAKSGGRIGGSAQAARKAPPPAARTQTNVINKTTVVEKNTTVVVPPPAPPVVVAPPPVVAPMGMGYGYGMAPVVVAPAPTIGDIIVGAAVGSAIHSAVAPHGPSTTDRILENQQRQDERQLDRQANQLEDLQRELAELKAKK